MSEYNFETITNRKNRGTIKWDVEHINARFHTHLTNDDDFYPMFIADSDFKLPDEVLNPIQALLKEPDFGYFTVGDGFYDAIIDWHHNKHQIDLKKEWIVPSAGTVTSLHILSCIFGTNKNFLVLTPVYRQFKACAAVGKLYNLALKYENKTYTIDFEALENSFKDNKIDIIIFCNPHNPGGKSWTYAELAKLVSLCKKYDVLLIADEIHSDIILSDNPFISLMNFADEYAKIVVATSPNKTFSVSGLSTSYLLCANEKIRNAYNEYNESMHLSVNRFGASVLEIVYKYGQAWHREMSKVVKANVQTVIDGLEEVGIEVMRPDAGYLVWVKLEDNVDVDELISKLALEESVLLETGSRFIADYEGFMRINLATSPSIVKEAIKRIKKVYLKLR